MSWMSPSYLLQSGFDRKWTSLAGRYSLWLYREVGWEGHEVRPIRMCYKSQLDWSLAPWCTSALHPWERGFFAPSAFNRVLCGASILLESPRSGVRISWESFEGTRFLCGQVIIMSTRIYPAHLRNGSVEFNEDLSAFHGTTLDAQKAYTRRAIDYILSLYPPDTPIVIMGHSMGGVVGVSLLPHPKVSAIITMSTPHTLPPARFDRRVDRIYSTNRNALLTEPTPILSMCGGATDLMIPSESCILPEALSTGNGSEPHRRTIFSSALEGSWTGVGHREMVWCHQVRWRIARAVLQLGTASTASGRANVLDTWLRDGQSLPPGYTPVIAPLALEGAEYLSSDVRLELKNPTGSRTYVMPAPGDTSSRRRFLLYVSQGSIPPTAPHSPLPLRASIYACSTTNTCQPLRADSLRLIPNPSLASRSPCQTRARTSLKVS